MKQPNKILIRSIVGALFLALLSCQLPTFVDTLPPVPHTSSPPGSPTQLTKTSSPSLTIEYPVTIIPIGGPLKDSNAEISGLGWYNDTLILLPQYPSRFEGSLFTLSKSEILAFLDGDQQGALIPHPIAFRAPRIRQQIEGYEGFEAIATDGDRVYLLIEADTDNKKAGYLITGTIEPDLSEIRIDMTQLIEIPSQTGLKNMTEEALLLVNDLVITLHEANGVNVNPYPVGHCFTDNGLENRIPFPSIEYRITDATATDAEGRFWAINYFYPGEANLLQPGPDPLIQRHGEGITHTQADAVERLVEFQYQSTGITLTASPPLQLELRHDKNARNWEGIARLDNRGFLIVTDTHPQTIFGFVPFTP